MEAAEEYAKRKGYVPQVLAISGRPNHKPDNPQANKTVEWFLNDEAVTAFYGFSGGGINMMHVLDRLASKNPETPTALNRLSCLVRPKCLGKSMSCPNLTSF